MIILFNRFKKKTEKPNDFDFSGMPLNNTCSPKRYFKENVDSC